MLKFAFYFFSVVFFLHVNFSEASSKNDKNKIFVLGDYKFEMLNIKDKKKTSKEINNSHPYWFFDVYDYADYELIENSYPPKHHFLYEDVFKKQDSEYDEYIKNNPNKKPALPYKNNVIKRVKGFTFHGTRISPQEIFKNGGWVLFDLNLDDFNKNPEKYLYLCRYVNSGKLIDNLGSCIINPTHYTIPKQQSFFSTTKSPNVARAFTSTKQDKNPVKIDKKQQKEGFVYVLQVDGAFEMPRQHIFVKKEQQEVTVPVQNGIFPASNIVAFRKVVNEKFIGPIFFKKEFKTLEPMAYNKVIKALKGKNIARKKKFIKRNNDEFIYSDPISKIEYQVKFYQDTYQINVAYFVYKMYRRLGIQQEKMDYFPSKLIYPDGSKRMGFVHKKINNAISFKEYLRSNGGHIANLTQRVQKALAHLFLLSIIMNHKDISNLNNILIVEDTLYVNDCGNALGYIKNGIMGKYSPNDISLFTMLLDPKTNPETASVFKELVSTYIIPNSEEIFKWFKVHQLNQKLNIPIQDALESFVISSHLDKKVLKKVNSRLELLNEKIKTLTNQLTTDSSRNILSMVSKKYDMFDLVSMQSLALRFREKNNFNILRSAQDKI